MKSKKLFYEEIIPQNKLQDCYYIIISQLRFDEFSKNYGHKYGPVDDLRDHLNQCKDVDCFQCYRWYASWMLFHTPNKEDLKFFDWFLISYLKKKERQERKFSFKSKNWELALNTYKELKKVKKTRSINSPIDIEHAINIHCLRDKCFILCPRMLYLMQNEKFICKTLSNLKSFYATK